MGLCGSDLHCYHEREAGCRHGTTLGHEFVGVVDQIGDQVTNIKVGDTVVSPFTTNCGAGDCWACSSGLTCRCPKGQLFGWINQSDGKGLQGAQAQFVRVPYADGTLLKITNSSISNEEALLLGDILSTGWFCAENAGIGVSLPKGALVVVIGCGPVGLMSIIAAKYLDPDLNLYALDSVPERLNMASKYGSNSDQSV